MVVTFRDMVDVEELQRMRGEFLAMVSPLRDTAHLHHGVGRRDHGLRDGPGSRRGHRSSV